MLVPCISGVVQAQQLQHNCNSQFCDVTKIYEPWHPTGSEANSEVCMSVCDTLKECKNFCDFGPAFYSKCRIPYSSSSSSSSSNSSSSSSSGSFDLTHGVPIRTIATIGSNLHTLKANDKVFQINLKAPNYRLSAIKNFCLNARDKLANDNLYKGITFLDKNSNIKNIDTNKYDILIDDDSLTTLDNQCWS